jgi:hypothetical protein
MQIVDRLDVGTQVLNLLNTQVGSQYFSDYFEEDHLRSSIIYL